MFFPLLSAKTKKRTPNSGLFCLIAVVGFAVEMRADEPPELRLSTWLKSQTDAGRINLEFYDPGLPRQFPGWTVFEYQFEFQYECQVSWPQKKPRPGSIVLVPTFTKLEIPITHRVELPRVLESDRWFEAVLARHELEHVRVGSHPRLVILSKHLVKKLKRIERTVDDPAQVTKEWIQMQVEGELKLRKDAIQSLVMDINRRIDKVTNHGALSLEDREEFFAKLFLKENLDQMKFPYLSEVLDLIDTREYLNTRIQIREIDIEPSQRMPPTGSIHTP
jgi:hypothetical protein